MEWLLDPPKSSTGGTKGKGYDGKGLRLVHHRRVNRRCAYDQRAEFKAKKAILADLPLSSFLGPDGLMQLLSFIGTRTLPTEECLEMIKRLHVPGYEQARGFFDAAIADQVFEPNTPKGYHWQSDIRAVLRWVAKRKA